MKLRYVIGLSLAPLALAACNQDGPKTAKPVAPAAKVVGAPESCVPIRAFNQSIVRDEQTIDFIRSGNRAWRNTLPHRCPGLRNSDGFTYETSLTQLCGTDIIYVLNRMGGSLQRGAGCGLGQFVPVELERK